MFCSQFDTNSLAPDPMDDNQCLVMQFKLHSYKFDILI